MQFKCKQSFTSFFHDIFLVSKNSSKYVPIGINQRSEDSVSSLSAIALHGGFGITIDQTSTITSVQAGPIQNNGIFYVVSRIAHDSHDGVLSGRQIFEMDQLNGSGLDHRSHRVDQVVEQRINSIPLIQGNGAHGLFTHCTLVSISGTLVVMRIGDQSGANSQ